MIEHFLGKKKKRERVRREVDIVYIIGDTQCYCTAVWFVASRFAPQPACSAEVDSVHYAICSLAVQGRYFRYSKRWVMMLMLNAS